MKRRALSVLLVLGSLLPLGCGTLLFEERHGQDAGRIDPNVIVLDGIGLVFFIVPGLLASLIVAWFSRQREFRADRGGAKLTRAGAMISALRRLGQDETSTLPKSMAAFGINGDGVMALLRSHPPIPERIQALQGG